MQRRRCRIPIPCPASVAFATQTIPAAFALPRANGVPYSQPARPREGQFVMRRPLITLAVVILFACAVPAAAQNGSSGTISGSNLILNGVSIPIVNGRVILAGYVTPTGSGPHCASFIVSPNGALSFGAVVPCFPTRILWTTPEPITQGTALSETQLNASATSNPSGTVGGLAGTFTYTPPLGTVMNTPGANTLSVTFTPNNTLDFASATATVTLMVTASPYPPSSYPLYPSPPWTFAGPPARGWSGTINGSTFIYDGATYLIENGRVYFPDCTVFVVGPNGRLSGGALRPNCVASLSGLYAMTIPTITWADPAPVPQGSVLGWRQLNASVADGITGNFFYTPPGGTLMDTPGPHILLVRFEPHNQVNFASVTATVTLNVIAYGARTNPAGTNPNNGGGWWGEITGSNLYYNNAYYPIVNGRVNLPDCTTWIVGPNG